MTDIILASSSEIRGKMLTDAGVKFTQISPRIDEEQVKAALLQEGATSRDIADTLAEYKARKIAQKHQDAIVLGSDQVLDFEGRLISKARSWPDLVDLLKEMRGRTHRLVTAVVVFDAGKPVWRSVKTVQMTMRAASDAYIDDYVSRNWDDVRWCVGGYQLEGEGARLFADVRGDYFTVLGMPLLDVLSYLTQRGIIPG